MLQNIKELKPLFRKFGVNTMSDALDRELQGRKTRTVSKSARPKKIRQANIRHAKRTFNLLPSDTDLAKPQYNLPQLNMHEGVVRLDNKVEPRATVDAESRTVRWSRMLDDGRYEHGYVDLRDHGMSGAGAVLISSNPDQATVPTSGSGTIVPFNAVKANVTAGSNLVQAPLQHSQVSKNRKQW